MTVTTRVNPAEAQLQELRERQFVEEVGLWMESVGMTRMAGRVFGRLLVAEPTPQSSAELAEYLQASKASISTTTRQLIALGLVRKAPVAGGRATYFEAQPQTFDQLVAVEVARSRVGRELMARGLQTLAGRPPVERERLQELHDLFEFFERELPTLVDRWRATREPR